MIELFKKDGTWYADNLSIPHQQAYPVDADNYWEAYYIAQKAFSPAIILRSEIMHPAVKAILPYFAYDHLPDHLQEVSKPFHDLAHEMVEMGEGPELTAGLRKLLEAKDCAVRAAIND